MWLDPSPKRLPACPRPRLSLPCFEVEWVYIFISSLTSARLKSGVEAGLRERMDGTAASCPGSCEGGAARFRGATPFSDLMLPGLMFAPSAAAVSAD